MMPPNLQVTVLDNIPSLLEFEELVTNQSLIAFDSEGVDLSRIGELTLMSFGVELQNGDVHVFLLDPIQQDLNVRRKTLEVAKHILQSTEIIKIIHDCRQDSDALYRVTQPCIKLRNVFDTQVWDYLANRSLRR